ncbi:MAG: class I SAM-dependent methyltransferase [Mesorhizobium sp.]|nr:class I SAM-dependent methyltransferase [bacterium M00.F.Ca.ET.205.01.1.1]TGU54520.1 class I SAM-dependent methyltransferase [bacterium M00.F.Ca.ET.152.01.1.1]TGV38695.1 class I SAM-dependent methyltransferase [Mesorhizobium sp. M00.F.Ca.ET.186.01.1.1]TGZ44092.1 class I SAM-dependent methyltransferase [bacterium M00.F.Ca.ET.162.01.1.1]TIW59811.1 MAG: class I SAM-dependent methyltransferase [Mesorhizobium sp.]
MTGPEKFLAQSRQTIESYEDYAVRYDEIVGHVPHPNDQAALERAAAIAGPGGRVLEIGSGPGRDADFLETLGVEVRRTDATRRFLELQAARGKAGELLDVITDELGGPYDAVVALAMLIHVPRDQIDQVLAKIARSLRPGGAFVVTMRDGDGETGGRYLTVDWRREAFAARMEAAGMEVLSHSFRVGRKERGWNTFLAVRPS